MFLYTGHLMNDIWFSNIYFRDLDDKESQKVGLSHVSSITALIKQEKFGSKSRFYTNFFKLAASVVIFSSRLLYK